MSTNKIIIFGVLDLAELAHYYISRDTDYEIVGFTVNRDYMVNDKFSPKNSNKTYNVYPFENLEDIFSPLEYSLFAPITGSRMNKNRELIYNEGKSKGYSFISYVSPMATINDNIIGENCFIFEDNTLQPFTDIGNNVIIWSGNHIGHHGKIDDHVFITSHVVISGHCHIKSNSWIGVNSTIKDGIVIGEGTLIGMGSLITKSTEDECFYMGSPAKKQDKKPIDVI